MHLTAQVEVRKWTNPSAGKMLLLLLLFFSNIAASLQRSICEREREPSTAGAAACLLRVIHWCKQSFSLKPALGI